MSEAMTPTSELKRRAEAAFNAAVEVDMFQKGSKSQQDADNVRIMRLSEFHRAANPRAILALIARLEKAEAALRPFANEATRYDPDDGDDADTAWDGDFPIRVYRAARAALEDKTMTMTTEQIEALRQLALLPNFKDFAQVRTTELAALCTLALRGLATMPRPIEEAVIGERYLFFSYGKFRIVDTWCSPWLENHQNWPEPFTHCILLSALESPKP